VSVVGGFGLRVNSGRGRVKKTNEIAELLVVDALEDCHQHGKQKRNSSTEEKYSTADKRNRYILGSFVSTLRPQTQGTGFDPSACR